MDEEFVSYAHWSGRPKVWVRKKYKGLHRKHCLCHVCNKFIPEDRDSNCTRANLVFSVCVALDMTLPVWECPAFKRKGA